MDKVQIPFNLVDIQGNELEYIQQSISNGHISGDGEYSKMCDSLFEDEIGVKKSLLTPSCTDALEMCAILLNVKPGDEIIVPSFTFVSTINTFVLRGAKPIFIDIRPDTLNIDETLLENLISPKTKAIVVVHYAGVGCEMNSIVAIAKKYSIPLIEDNAHGLFGKYKGQYLGTFGTFATQSFHETKNFTCGEGGALFINDERYIDRAEIIREKGTNRSQFFRGEVDKYTWVDIGSSYLLSDLSAAFLYGQLEQRLVIQEKRKNIWNTYFSMLKTWAEDNGIQLPFVPKECKQAFHMFYLIMPSLNDRTRFINYLKQNGLHAVFHYLPLHLSPMGEKLSSSNTDCPVTESISDRLVRLPFFTNLNMDEIDFEIFYKFQ
jgi:dTDP-4-amino-4,6-dideoxygalactose transaminase